MIKGIYSLIFIAALAGLRIYFFYYASQHPFNLSNGFQSEVDEQTNEVSVSADTARSIMEKIGARLQGGLERDSASPPNASSKLEAGWDATQKQLNAWEIVANKQAGQPRVPS